MLQRLLYALPLVALGVLGTTGSAMAAFDPTKDELSVGTAIFAAAAMGVLLLIYAVKWYFGLDRQAPVEFPDHAHDHRYQGHH
jgi:hypothetical protein